MNTELLVVTIKVSRPKRITLTPELLVVSADVFGPERVVETAELLMVAVEVSAAELPIIVAELDIITPVLLAVVGVFGPERVVVVHAVVVGYVPEIKLDYSAAQRPHMYHPVAQIYPFPSSLRSHDHSLLCPTPYFCIPNFKSINHVCRIHTKYKSPSLSC